MSFSSRRRNYLLTPHRRDGLIEWMKSMLMHSFVLDTLETTGADTFSHFEVLIDEHIEMSSSKDQRPSRLKKLVPTVGTFHTRLPLRTAFEAYNRKYAVTKRKHICISFNELRHILNLAQIMALRGGKYEENGDRMAEEVHALKQWESSPSALQSDHDLLYGSSNRGMQPPSPPPLTLDAIDEDVPVPNQKLKFKGPQIITFDGDQTLYSDGANFESNPELANYLYLLLRYGVTLAVVTAAGYEYNAEKYEVRLSGLLAYFKERNLPPEDCERFFLFGGECNYLLTLGHDYSLHPVKEYGPGGWLTSTKYLPDSPANWDDEEVNYLLDVAETIMKCSVEDQKIRGRVIRKKRAVGLIPNNSDRIPREALDETVLCVQEELQQHGSIKLPFCAFNGGRDVWVDVGNKRVGVEILCSYLGMPALETLHIGDQFLNTGNDFAARDICPCIWITSPDETTYILKSILRLAGAAIYQPSLNTASSNDGSISSSDVDVNDSQKREMNFSEIERRDSAVKAMDVYTGEMIVT